MAASARAGIIDINNKITARSLRIISIWFAVAR